MCCCILFVNCELFEVRVMVVGKLVVSFFVKVGLDKIVSECDLFKIFLVIVCNNWLVLCFKFLVVYIIWCLGWINGLIFCSILVNMWFGIIISKLCVLFNVCVKLFLILSVLGKGILGKKVWFIFFLVNFVMVLGWCF